MIRTCLVGRSWSLRSLRTWVPTTYRLYAVWTSNWRPNLWASPRPPSSGSMTRHSWHKVQIYVIKCKCFIVSTGSSQGGGGIMTENTIIIHQGYTKTGGYWRVPLSESLLVDENFVTWLLIGWQNCIMLCFDISDKRIKIDLIRDTSVLSVSDSRPDDSGRYTVVVENELGCDTCNSSVTIEGKSGLILGLRPANERWRYFVTTYLIGWAQAQNQSCKCDCINSLWPNDAVWRYRSRSLLAQVRAWCLTAPSPYLNQCWLTISEVQWQTPDGNFRRTDTSAIWVTEIHLNIQTQIQILYCINNLQPRKMGLFWQRKLII